GLHRAIRRRAHEHKHLHEAGDVHTHEHAHIHEHAHAHTEGRRNLTPWVLFTIFVFGPCEPLIPILMYPAAASSVSGMVLVAAVFAVVTIATMLSVVMLSAWGISFTRLGKFEHFSHAAAGAAICMSGLAIQLLGL
ncbi:MAG: sulfite exporter TauE/SafE family protein, partial [Lentisphaerae bacterium]|nr:sulfite exporter TauE/SafE family protein [Lentisphaerota bacterium]